MGGICTVPTTYGVGDQPRVGVKCPLHYGEFVGISGCRQRRNMNVNVNVSSV